MTTHFDFGGKQRPFRLGIGGLIQYETETGRYPLADINKCITLDIEKMSVVILTDLIFYSMSSGYKREKIEVDFDKDDVADWISDDFVRAGEILGEIVKSLLDKKQLEGNVQPGKSKATTPKPTK